MACATSGHDPSSGPGSPATPPSAAPAAAPAAAAAPVGASPLFTFRGDVDVVAGAITIAPTTGTGIQPDYAQLPEGAGANQVTVHTVPGSVLYDTSNTSGCGGTAVDPHLCGTVQIISHYPAALSEVTAAFSWVVPSTVTTVGAPYVYGAVAGGSTSANIEWVFDDPSKVSFSFYGTIWGTPPGGSDGGADSGGSADSGSSADSGDASSPCGTCSSPTPVCDTSNDTCVVCVDNTQCPSGYSCQNKECINVSGNYGYCGEEECEAELPYCDTVNMECVECLYAWHCELIGKDFCEGNICVSPKN